MLISTLCWKGASACVYAPPLWILSGLG